MPSPKNREQGSTLAWTALLLALVVVPLLGLLTNTARLYLIRSGMQTATEAACEDAAWSAADRATFQETGVLTFLPAWQVASIAQATYTATLPARDRLNYITRLQVRPDFANRIVRCTATARVPWLFVWGRSGFTVAAASSIRVR